MWNLHLPDLNNIDPETQKFIDELRADTEQLKKDIPYLTKEEFDERQKKILKKSGIGMQEERPDLTNGWIEPDGTFHRLLIPHYHEMWSFQKFGMKHRELMAKGWVKVTQWEKMTQASGMYFTELTPEQEIKLKELNVKCSEISRFY
jgi:hypothetical protein